MNASCSVFGCQKPAKTKGMCGAHYQRHRKYGDPLHGRLPDGETERYFKEVVIPYLGNECLIWPYYRRPGFGYGVMMKGGRPHHVSRLVCIEAYGNPPTPQHQAAHSCGKGHLGCVARNHLRWSTPAENNADRITHGTVPKGAAHWNARLTSDQVAEIRSLSRNLSGSAIAAQFGITRQYVYQIKRNVRRNSP